MSKLKVSVLAAALMGAALTLLMACAGAGPAPSPVVQAPAPPPTYYVNISGLALREGPTTAARQISTLEFNDQVELLGPNEGWGQVLDKRRNIQGWAAVRYLQPRPAHRPQPVPRHETPAPKAPAPQPPAPEPSEPPAPAPSGTPVPRVM